MKGVNFNLMAKTDEKSGCLQTLKFTDEFYMGLAMYLASLAADIGEVPVGAVVVHRTKGVVGIGINRREILKNALYHAEIEAIDSSCKTLGGWRLFECDLYVTLEPCPMCAGAIINSRIRRVIFGAYDVKGGACSSVMSMFDMPFNHKPVLSPYILGDKCSAQLSEFFKALRKTKKRRRRYIPPT